jgi:hypothetical protein
MHAGIALVSSVVAVASALSACGGRVVSDQDYAAGSLGGNANQTQGHTGGQSATAIGGAGSGGTSSGGTNFALSGAGGSGASPAGSCSGPNSAGCAMLGCPNSYVCDASVGCHPSMCTCTSYGWMCTADCGGGECIPIEPGSSAAGASGCATRSVTYSAGVQFVYQYASIIGYPSCVPTCGVPANSVQGLPAGPCTAEPTCAMLAFWDCPTFCTGVDSGSMGANGFLCACVSGAWSCTIAQ